MSAATGRRAFLQQAAALGFCATLPAVADARSAPRPIIIDALGGIADMPAYMRALEQEVAQRRASGIGATGERADIVPFLPDLQGPQKFQKLAGLLAQRGHSTGRIEKILGLNFLRAASGVWG